MKSHTVPRFLLDQFAYDDPATKSRRLWQYTKGRAPTGFASPRSATRIDGHFSDPENAEREAKLERRLNDEFENPIHEILPLLSFRTFALSPIHIRQLARYVTLLYARSSNRRRATKQQIAMAIVSTRSWIDDAAKVSKLAARWTSEFIRMGIQLENVITSDEVRQTGEKLIANMQTLEYEQTTYVDSIERTMSVTDEELVNGMWNVMSTTLEYPFVIGDSPIATWRRSENGNLVFGQGILTSDVEMVLPVSSTTCLHILPTVERTRAVYKPSVREVNRSQAAYAMRYCYAYKYDAEIDRMLQPDFHTVHLGLNALTLKQRYYDETMFELLSGESNSIR